MNGANSRINALEMIFTKQMSGDFFFNSCNLTSTKITGSNYDGKTIFNHCNFNSLDIDFLNNYSTLTIISAKAFGNDSYISIAHSDLGSFYLYNVFLNSFDYIRISNSVLTGIIAANVKWFEKEKLNSTQSEKSYDHSQRKEIFRQIKIALDKQGDKISSLKFKSWEMKEFKQELFAQKEWYRRIIDSDSIILWLGQTNNFGQNWFKPVLLAVLCTTIFYCLIMVSLSPELSWKLSFYSHDIKNTVSIFCEGASAIPQLMNPTHSLAKVFPEKDEFSFAVEVYDYFLKIVLAFFIFQTISAFRKYAK